MAASTSSFFFLHPFTAQILQSNGLTTSSSEISLKTFLQACSSLFITSPHSASIESSAWKFFLSLSLTMMQINIFYRFINNCIPHQDLLNRMFPTVYLSSLCAVCSTHIDSTDHFLFYCPKALVWQGIISEFLWPTVTIADIRLSILHINFYNIRYSQKPKSPSHFIVLITLANIWRANIVLFSHSNFLNHFLFWPTSDSTFKK